MGEADRTRKVAELLKRELAILISRELNDTRINGVTVTGVTVSRDLKQSTVYVSSIKSSQVPDQVEKLLNKSAKYLRYLVSQKIDLRFTPALIFRYDDSIEKGVEMTQLVEKLNRRHESG